MLSIILTILKIIGIILLIFLILISTVLIVPVRYEAKGAYKKNELPLLRAKVHWLLRSVLLQVELQNNKPVIKFKLLGKTIMDTSKPKQRKNKEADKTSNIKDKDKTQNKKRKTKNIEIKDIEKKDKKLENIKIQKDININREEEKTLIQRRIQEEHAEKQQMIEEVGPVNILVENQNDELSELEKITLHNIERLSTSDNNNMAEKMDREKTISLQIHKTTESGSKSAAKEKDFSTQLKKKVNIGKSSVRKSFKEESSKEQSLKEENSKKRDSKKQSSKEEASKNQGFKGLTNNKNKTFIKIKNIINKIKHIIFNIPLYLEKSYSKIEDVISKKDKLMLFFEDKKNKKTFALIKRQSFRAMKHILPGRLKGRLYFGFDSPATTGYISGILAIFYGSYGRKVAIQPDFENKVLECDLYFKGRIRIITVIIIGMRLLLDKNFLKLLKQARNML